MTDVISATQNRLIWASINWREVEQQVRKRQVRIVKAVKKGEATSQESTAAIGELESGQAIGSEKGLPK